MTPYERGYAARLSGSQGPRSVPNGNASWAEKLFYRGWCDALGALKRGARTSWPDAKVN